MAKAPMMPVWTDALIGDTTHLSAEQFGCYVLILIATWRNNGKALPNDDERMAKICRISLVKWKNSVRPIVSEFFNVSDSGWHQQRLEKEWNRVSRWLSQQRAKGQAGGKLSSSRRSSRKQANHNQYKNKTSSSSILSSARACVPAHEAAHAHDDFAMKAIGDVVAKVIGTEIPETPAAPAAVDRIQRQQEHMQWLAARGDRDMLDTYVMAQLSDDQEAAERMFSLVENQMGEAA